MHDAPEVPFTHSRFIDATAAARRQTSWCELAVSALDSELFAGCYVRVEGAAGGVIGR